VPDYLSHLPRDPRNHEAPDEQYLYISDSAGYKLISHAPDDYADVSRKNPAMIDPVRPGWAYGFWTSDAEGW
jgi:hypothetical protein